MNAPGTVVGPAAARPELVPYVPRIVLEWLREAPGDRWREIEGTVAFVDLSGFTSMSERLARLGKPGAEEVTGIMNATFAALLGVAYERGGSLLKFGGDALLLFVAGDEHEARACRAAFEMRRTLRAVGRPRTSAGAVQLRMHAGIHSGRFHFFLVGASHRELLVTGPAATRTVEMESGSAAGEIVVSDATARALPPATVAAGAAGGMLLRRAPPAAARSETLPDVEALDIAAVVPSAIRDHVGTPAAEGEHRQAALAFLHFGGTDRLIADEGAEAAADALQALVTEVQRAADEHGVSFLETDIDRDGGKIVLVAGAPRRSENDEERLLRTARALVDAAPPLPLRVGVNRGAVFAGEVGAPFRRTYTVLGDTAALAARLAARAQPGQILVAASVVQRSRTRFATVELPPFRVKGKEEPVVAHELGPVLGTRAERDEPRLPIVGRERELAILTAALAPARGGSGMLVEIVGDAGIGKSRLVEELRAAAADMTVLTTACEQYELSTPYFAFRDLLRAVVDVSFNGSAATNTEGLAQRLEAIAPDLVPWIPLLAVPLDVAVEPTRETDELEPAFRRARLHGVVGALLGALLTAPTALVFEDVHWMDEASAELLRHLAAQLQTKPWFACATRRPTGGGFSAADGTPPVPALTIRLDPLSGDAARAFVVAAAGERLRADEIDAIAERAGGNPLFLQELVAAGAAEGDSEELPESVEAVVTARIDRLAAADRALLRWASVLGHSFTGKVVERVLEGDPSAAAGSEAWDRLAEFVERDPDVPGGYRFRHALIRDAAYEGLPYRRRSELHARVGETYEEMHAGQTDDVAELLSLHFLRADAYEKAWRYSLVAAGRASAKFANVEAAEFYRRAIDASRRLPELAPSEIGAVWEALADVLALAGAYEDAARAFKQARALFRRAGVARPALFVKEGRLRENMGSYSEALRSYGLGFKAVDDLADEAERTESRIELSLAYAAARLRQGKFADCISWCRRALDDAQEAGHLAGLAHAYYLLHLAYTSLGSPERVALRGLALPIYEELGDLLGQANVLVNLGIDAYYEGRWSDALDLYNRSNEFAERIGDVIGVARTTNNIAEIKSDQGHLDEASRLFEQVYATCQAAGSRLLATVARGNLGRVAARDGRHAEARELLDEALAGFREIGAASFVLETEARLAELSVLTGSHAEALPRANALLARIRGTEAGTVLAPLLERVRGHALLQSGDPEGARAAFDASLGAGRGVDADYEVALTLRALAAVDDTRADELAAESDEVLRRLGVVSTPAVPLP